MKISMILNGKKTEAEIDADMLLIDFVRSQGCCSVKRGCETSNCGLCTVFLEGKPAIFYVHLNIQIPILQSALSFLLTFLLSLWLPIFLLNTDNLLFQQRTSTLLYTSLSSPVFFILKPSLRKL